MKPRSHAQHFRQLTTLLATNSELWRCEPFKSRPNWVSHKPELAAHLGHLDMATVRDAQANDTDLLACLTGALPEQCQQISSLCQVPALPAPSDAPRPGSHIPGRKWQQIIHFAAALEYCDATLLEWCAGKSHLGRWLSQRYGCSVTALERDAALIASAQSLTPAVQLEECDVLSSHTLPFLRATEHVVALHACGGLHRKLLQDANDCSLARITWSPCCYHKYLEGDYQALSDAGKESALNLSTVELRTAVRQNTTAGRAERIRHEKLQAWRLGFIRLQSKVLAGNEYLPISAIPAEISRGDFENFCRYVADIKSIELPDNIAFEKYETLGKRLYTDVSRQELVRALFRRPLELWLALDEILFLEERGYRCELGTFCDPQVTPRNFLINALRERNI